MTFDKLLDKYRRMSFSERDKGTRFERLMQAYLQTDPKYENLFCIIRFYSALIPEIIRQVIPAVFGTHSGQFPAGF